MARISFIQGKEVEWADLRAYINGIETVKFTAVNEGVKVSKEHLFAGGDDPIGIQSGNREPTGSITLLKGDFDAFEEAAIAAGGRDVTDISWNLVMYFKPKGIRPPRTVTLIGCEISDFDRKMAQGDKKMEIALPFLHLRRVSAAVPI